MQEITFATTTSAQDSGLLGQLLPKFEKDTGYKVKVLSVGSGMANNLAKQGKAGVLLVHDPEAEKELMDQGIGINRRLVMHNDFILVGPSNDPAGIRGMDSVVDAFKKIASTNSLFISRGDSSGTDRKEKAIWEKAAIDPRTANYQTTSSGMAETLAIASGKDGYVLTDRATFLSKKQDLKLETMIEGDNLLLNVYHTLQVNPDQFPHLNADGAKALIDFLVGRSAQGIIGNFLKDRYRQPLFVPDAGRSMEDVISGNWKQPLIQ